MEIDENDGECFDQARCWGLKSVGGGGGGGGGGVRNGFSYDLIIFTHGAHKLQTKRAWRSWYGLSDHFNVWGEILAAGSKSQVVGSLLSLFKATVTPPERFRSSGVTFRCFINSSWSRKGRVRLSLFVCMPPRPPPPPPPPTHTHFWPQTWLPGYTYHHFKLLNELRQTVQSRIGSPQNWHVTVGPNWRVTLTVLSIVFKDPG